MNKETIEHLLRKIPAEQPPNDLLASLTRDVTLQPDVCVERAVRNTGPNSWTRRWLPTIGFAAWFLGCVVVFGYQSARINQLKQQQATIKGEVAAVSGHTSQPSTAPPASADVALASSDEIVQLRAEVDRLRKDIAAALALKEENTRLRAELKARAPAAVNPEQDFFAAQQDRALRIQCINHLKQVALAAHMQASDLNSDVLTKDLSSLTSYLKDGNKFRCSDGKTAYHLISPGASKRDPQLVLLYCPVHHNAALADGSAHQLSPEQKLVDSGNGIHLGR